MRILNCWEKITGWELLKMSGINLKEFEWLLVYQYSDLIFSYGFYRVNIASHSLPLDTKVSPTRKGNKIFL